jgi:hypothetical protein
MKANGPFHAVSLLAAALVVASSSGARAAEEGEPLPSSAPTQPYELAAWCYGAMSEYVDIYDRVEPELKNIDKLFGTSVKNEADPYSSDMAAARDEVKVLAKAVEAAEKASAQVIAPQGSAAVKMGRGIWNPAEGRTKRELARAWLSWALPDRCDSNARELATKSALLGQALKYNTFSATDAAPPPADTPRPADTPPSPQP